MKNKKSLLLVLGLLLFNLGCGLTIQSNPISIDKVIIAGEVDDNGVPVEERDEFGVDQPAIYCVIYGHGGDNMVVRLKWYREDKLLGDQLVHLGPEQHNYGYIQLQPGFSWTPGEYHADVALVEDPIKTVYFSIK